MAEMSETMTTIGVALKMAQSSEYVFHGYTNDEIAEAAQFILASAHPEIDLPAPVARFLGLASVEMRRRADATLAAGDPEAIF